MTQSSKLNLLDVTIRDGSYLIKHQYSENDILTIYKNLYQAGIKNIEVSHGCGFGAKRAQYQASYDDETIIKKLTALYPSLNLCIFLNPYFDFSLALTQEHSEYFKMARIGINVHEVSQTKKLISQLKSSGKIVSLQLVRSHARDENFVAHAAQKAEALGADIVYLVDSFGSMDEEIVKSYLGKMQEKCPSLTLGYHAHNNLGNALSSTLTAVEMGCEWVDASLLGVGRGAGNTSILELIDHIPSLDDIDAKQLEESISEIILPLFGQAPSANEYDQLSAQYKVDYPEENFLYQLAKLLNTDLTNLMKSFCQDPEFVDINPNSLKKTIELFGQDPLKILNQLK